MALLDNLISHWKLDEASGNALDAHGANTLTQTSGTIGSAAGKLGNARVFASADTEYFEIADNADLSTGDVDFELACWVYANSLTSFPVIATKGWPAGSSDAEWVLYYETGSSRFRFEVAIGTGNVGVSANNFGAASTGVWYRLHAWHDSVNNVIGISVNAGTPNTASHTTGVNNGTRSFQLGAAKDFPLYWNGLIDEFSFWKGRVLTSDERTTLYNGGAGKAYPWKPAQRWAGNWPGALTANSPFNLGPFIL